MMIWLVLLKKVISIYEVSVDSQPTPTFNNKYGSAY